MTGKANAGDVVVLDAGEVRRFVARIFEAAGWSTEDARITADNLASADEAGHASHGIGLMPGYVETMKAGLLSPKRTMKVLKEDGPFIVIDADMALGQVTGRAITTKAIAAARSHGIAMASLLNSHHVGRIGQFGEMVAAEGFVGLFWVNVHGRIPTVVPFGAREPRFSTNPHCVAIPRAGHPPFLLDFATAEIAVNKARVAAAKGQKVRPGVLVDNMGRPSDDPGVLFTTPRGSIAAFGQHKGSGLAIACELMAAAMAGGITVAAQEVHGAICNTMTMLVVDPKRMATSDEPAEVATERMIAYVKSAAAAEGVAEVLTPGEPEQRNRARLGGRLEIDPKTWGDIVKAAGAIGVAEGEVPKAK